MFSKGDPSGYGYHIPEYPIAREYFAAMHAARTRWPRCNSSRLALGHDKRLSLSAKTMYDGHIERLDAPSRCFQVRDRMARKSRVMRALTPHNSSRSKRS